MHRLCVPLSAALVLCSQSAGAAAAEHDMQNAAYPGAVALSKITADTWVYKSFPQLLPLYTFKGEPAGRSLCDRPCTAVWPIVAADRNDKPMGLWTIVKRDDGRLQWAYKSNPVYTYFEDRPNEPKGAGKSMDWYLDERGLAYLASVGVQLPSAAVATQAAQAQRIQATAQLLQP